MTELSDSLFKAMMQGSSYKRRNNNQKSLYDGITIGLQSPWAHACEELDGMKKYANE